ncbi:amidinotransferase [Streptomyces sp. V4-01]|uniref:Amidinotransferase n=1 Tax=Actinacidiphila polyblastidii TaxID=3110430 RepID=A0ABU7PIB8_9ACTN|nr:amidinotransferase [Streptomyces sp. V4-01]
MTLAEPRHARPRHFLMCPPTHFDVTYAINAWMDPGKPVDRALALLQWERLRDLYLDLGHRVDLIDPLPGLPDMVYAANGATVVDGKALGARFRNPERAAEGPAYLEWLRERVPQAAEAGEVNEGEGDFLVAGPWLLAGTGFRSSRAAHAEAQEFFGRPVIGLELVDERYYHLDTALAVLTDDLVAYYPGAFSPGSRAVLERLFPDAVLADAADATVFGLNAVSDGRHVVLPAAATGLAGRLRERGFEPVGVDLSELLKGGGSVKCCTLELRWGR